MMNSMSKFSGRILSLLMTTALLTGCWADNKSESKTTGKDQSSKTEKADPKSEKMPSKATDTVSPEKTDKDSEKPCNTPTSGPSKFDISKGFSTIAEKVIPAVVNVSTTQIIEGKPGKDGIPQFAPGSPFEDLFKDFFEQMERPRRVQSLGSGFIIKSDDKSAYIVTNYHVIADAKKITIMLNDGTEIEGSVKAVDERTDLALILVKTEKLPEDKRKLPTIEWGDSDSSKVGDWVLAVGNPFGLGSTVTSGIISNRAREIGARGGRGNRISEYVDDFMQHDAPINMGNSGGPLFNLEGKIIGINTAIYSPSGGSVGIGFAIPSNLARDTVKQLLEFGRTKRGWLGVRIQPVDEAMAESTGLGKKRGFIVAHVSKDSPAFKDGKTGIKVGDIILEYDGKPLTDKSRLTRLVGETPVGKEVDVKVFRNGKEETIKITIGEFEKGSDRIKDDKEGEDKHPKSTDEGKEVLGLKLSTVTPMLKKSFSIPDNISGVVVLKTPEQNPLDVDQPKLGLITGDVITSAGSTGDISTISSPEDFSSKIDAIKKKGGQNILVMIYRSKGGDEFFTTLPITIKDTKDAKDEKKDDKKDTKDDKKK